MDDQNLAPAIPEPADRRPEEPKPEELKPEAVSSEPRQAPSGCLSLLGWLAVAPVLACFSPTFYSRAARQRTGRAALFFLAFMLVITSLQTCGIVWAFIATGQELRNAFVNGEIPEITISQGEAEVVKGPNPWVVANAGGFMAIDTTGQYTEIDRSRYTQGVLLTRTRLIVLNSRGEYQQLTLRQMQQAFNLDDPFVINADTMTVYWGGFSLIIAVVMLIVLILWNLLVRLAYIALIALVLWGIMALIRPGTGFGPVLATGLYALVPALLIVFLLSRLSVSFPGLTTLFLLIFWITGLALSFLPAKPYSTASLAEFLQSERPLRGWRALIALPLVLNIVLEMIFNWRAAIVILPLAFLTFGALAVVSFWPLFSKPPVPTQV